MEHRGFTGQSSIVSLVVYAASGPIFSQWPIRRRGTSAETFFIKAARFPKKFVYSRCSLHRLAMASSCLSVLRACALSFVLIFLQCASAYTGGATISGTILVIARDATSAENGAVAGLRGYGIPYEVLTVPQAGITSLPLLNSSATHGNYGGIVTISEVGYNYDTSYYSALTRRQWNDLYAYQSAFGVRMVRLDVFPTSDFGVTSLGGNVNDEPLTFTNTSAFYTAGLKT
jgi:hypothetical protein